MNRLAPIVVALVLTTSAQLISQPSQPYGVAQTHLENSILVYWYYPHVNDSIIALVDADPNAYCLYSTEDVGARIAAAFDLPPGPCAIAAVEVRLWPSDPFPQFPGDRYSPCEVSLHSTLSNDTSAAIIWKQIASKTPADLDDWLSVSVGESVESDSAVLVFRWLNGSATAPLPAIVYRGSFLNNYEGHLENGFVVWQKVYDSAALMRLVVSLPDVTTSRGITDGMPDSFCVFIFDSPSDEATATPTVLSISDSLHLTIDGEAAEGKYLAVAAWEDGVMGAKSKIIRLDVSTDVEESILPRERFALEQNFPNPFNVETVIHSRASADLLIFDVLGRKVAQLQSESINAVDLYVFRWPGKNEFGRVMPTGVYFYRQEGVPGVRKMILLK